MPFIKLSSKDNSLRNVFKGRKVGVLQVSVLVNSLVQKLFRRIKIISNKPSYKRLLEIALVCC